MAEQVANPFLKHVPEKEPHNPFQKHVPDQRGTLEQIGDFITKDVPDAFISAGEDVGEFVGDVYTAAVGDNPLEFPHRPEFFKVFAGDVTDFEEVEMNFLSQLPRSIHGKMEMISKHAPGATFPPDEFGNLMVVIPKGKYRGQFYLNKPGLSESDIQDVGAEALFQLPMMVGITKALGLVAGGTGFWGTVFGTGARVGGSSLGAGSGSILRDLAAQFAGADSQELDIDHAKLSAAFGAAGEAFIATIPVVAKALGKVLRNDTLYSKGKLTRAGRRAVKRLGMDPEIVTPQFAKQYKITIGKGGSAEQAARRAEAETLENVIPGGKNIELTEGQATGLAALQTEEQLAAKGAFGAEAEQRVSSVIGPRGLQDDALMQNRNAIESNLRGRDGAPQSEAGQGAKTTQEALSAEEQAGWLAKSRAYQVVEGSSGVMEREGVEAMQSNMMRAIHKTSESQAPGTYAIVRNELGALIDDVGGTTWKVSAVKMRALETIRQRLNSMSQVAGPEQAAAGRAKAAFDDSLVEMVNRALVNGDDAIVANMKAARKLNEIYRTKFGSKPGDIVGKIVKRDRTIDPETGEVVYGELIMQPSDVANMLLGASKLGAKTSEAINRIKGILGESSQGWRDLKGEAWFKLFKSQRGRGEGEAMFSPQKYKSALDEAVREYPEMMRALFTRQEMAQMQALKRVSQSLIPRSGAVNTSNTAVSILNTLTKNFGPIGRAAQAIFRKWAAQADEGAAATRSIQATTKPRPVNEREVAPSAFRQMLTPRRGSGAGLPPAGAVAQNRERQRRAGAFGTAKGSQ